ncbi:MAG TPA: aminotransferase class I/II-fold pyridoxal phosphate-dependent enzyme, partial [Chloroflexota bacterium]|nr:aminotransferase class I/II-fold pyridoxal phosphate-dependent enzyme [Chloroflexota bacterium]
KWSFYGDDVLAAWVAEMDYPIDPLVRAALHEAIERSATGYPPDPDHSGVPAACAAWLSRSFGFALEPRQIRILPNVLHGIVLAIGVFSRPDSPVVIMTPSYPPFFETVRMSGRQIVEVPMLDGGDRPGFDLDAIGAALRAGAGTVILCNPHNPLGRVFTRAELAALADIVEAHGARVVVDELHAPLVYPGAAHVPYAMASEVAARHSVTLVSATKGWNLPGLKCAQLVLTNEPDIARWDRLSYLQTSGASILGMLANRVAFEQGGAWLHDVVTYLDGNRTLLARLLSELLPQVPYSPPQATYLAWLDCRALGLDNPATFFLQRARVALTDGADFGMPGRGYVRLNFATSRAILTTIVRRMAASLET